MRLPAWLAGAVMLAVISAAPARAADLPPAEDDIAWDMDSLARVVRPLKHDIGDRWPMILWSVPFPRGDALVKMRDDGSLRKHVDTLAARGMVPTVELGGDGWTPAGAMAMALTLKEARQAVFILIPLADFLEAHAYRDCPVWAEGPDASQGGKVRRWPCLPLADAEKGAAAVGGLLQPFRDAKIDVAGVWFHDRSLPHPWDGVYEATVKSADCRKHYPPDALGDVERFRAYVYGLRNGLVGKVMTRPALALFPGAYVGNYDDYTASTRVPRLGNLYWRDRQTELEAMMPALHRRPADLARVVRDRVEAEHGGKPEAPMTQERADRLYVQLMLAGFYDGTIGDHHDVIIPYLSRRVPAAAEPGFDFRMSPAAYREVLYHLWLRRVETMYLYNLGAPGSGVSPRESFESLEDARAVFDDVLASDRLRRDQLYEWPHGNRPAVGSSRLLWSAVRLSYELTLVRTYAPAGTDWRKIEVPVDQADAYAYARIDVPPGGATFLAGRNKKVERIEDWSSRAATRERN